MQRQLVVRTVSAIALSTLLAAARAAAQDGPIIPGLEDVPAVTYPQDTVERQSAGSSQPAREPLTQSRPDPFGEGGASRRPVVVPRQGSEDAGRSDTTQPATDAQRQALERYRQSMPQQRALQQQQQLQQQRATGGYRNQTPQTMRTSDPTWNTPQQDNSRRTNPGLQAVPPDPRAMQRPYPTSRDPRAGTQGMQQRVPSQGTNPSQALRAQSATGKARSTTAPQGDPAARGAQSWRPQQAPPQRSGAKAWNAPQR